MDTQPVGREAAVRSELTCPHCGAVSHHLMPADACQYFLDCPHCRTVVRPKAGDCCVFCSYGSVPCPPKQREAGCGI